MVYEVEIDLPHDAFVGAPYNVQSGGARLENEAPVIIVEDVGE